MFYRMDPKSSYLLKIRLVGNPRCRKEISCFIFEKVVDSDICNFKDLVDEIVYKYFVAEPPKLNWFKCANYYLNK